MPTILLYLLKVIICSGILYGYYRLFLCNRIFHRWNRFYLLGVVLVSIFFPLVKINIEPNAIAESSQVVRLLQVITVDGASMIEERISTPLITWEQVAVIGYLIVSILMALFVLQALFSVYWLLKHSAITRVDDVSIVHSDARGTPFSFFSYIFWNSQIDLASETGKNIFKHELTHVRERHSADRLFFNITLILFWSNPFFWLIRKELIMIHEFIADSKAVEGHDTSAFAAMIMQSSYPQHRFDVTSNFFSSSIKRRLLMLKKLNKPGTSYLDRVLALPLFVLVFAAFALKTKSVNNEIVSLKEPITVVIDAGHGGREPGARAEDGSTEKTYTLAIAKKVKELNNNQSIKVLLTRETDVFHTPRDRVNWTIQQKPDAYISIHVNAASTKMQPRSGFEIHIDSSRNRGQESRVLASLVAEEISNSYPVLPKLIQNRERRILALDAEAVNYPALLIECGYLTDKKDFAFIKDEKNQEKIARNILKAIERYAQVKNEAVSGISTQIVSPPADPYLSKGVDPKKALYIINGKASTRDEASAILQENIRSMNILGKENRYGEKGKHGVVEVVTYQPVMQDDKIFVKAEKEAAFPGGEKAWKQYIQKHLSKNEELLKQDNKKGTCVVQFIVDTEGELSNIEALTMKGSKLADISVDLIANGPKWIPAQQNGHIVKAYRRQAVSF